MNKAFNFRKIVALAMVTFALARASAQNPDLFFEKPFPYQDINGNMENDKPYCYINHPENYEYKPDVFLLKFFSDGSLSTSDTGSGLHVRPYRLYPNPV